MHGYALGAGAGLAFGSDLVVAAESARFGYPELKAGLTATTVTAQAVHLMGRKVAFELLTLCDNMLPGRAYVWASSTGSYQMTNCWRRHGAGGKPGGLGQAATVADQTDFQRSLSMDMDKALEMARDVSVMMGRFPA